MTTARVAEHLCKKLYPIDDPFLYDNQTHKHFGALVGLHYFLAALYALHLYARWSSYLRAAGAQKPSSEQALAANSGSEELETPETFDGTNSLSGPSSTLPRQAFAARIRKKLFVFSVSNCFSNLLIGTSWLFWMFGNVLLSDINSPKSMNESIQLQVVFYAIFPVGIFCFLISAFAFSDIFVALCISKNSLQPRMKLFSWRCMWIPVVLFLGVAVSGYVTLGYQKEAGRLQNKCFENAAFENFVAYLS
jgi:hypothetical protein